MVHTECIPYMYELLEEISGLCYLYVEWLDKVGIRWLGSDHYALCLVLKIQNLFFSFFFLSD